MANELKSAGTVAHTRGDSQGAGGIDIRSHKAIRYKDENLQREHVEKIIQILIQKCKDTLNESEVFKRNNLVGDRVFKDVNQYLNLTLGEEKRKEILGHPRGIESQQQLPSLIKNTLLTNAKMMTQTGRQLHAIPKKVAQL